MSSLYRFTLVGLFALFVTGSCISAQADVTYEFTVNTSSLAGTNGYVDLQFNPGGIDALSAFADLSQVRTDGRLTPTAIDTGGATGSLPGSVTLANSTNFNDLFQGVVFGNTLQFDATFSGSALTPANPQPNSGSAFALSLYANDQVTPLLTADPSGSVAIVDINPDGSTLPTTFADTNGITHASISLVVPTAVPEPGSIGLLVSLSIMGVGSFIQQKRFQRNQRLPR